MKFTPSKVISDPILGLIDIAPFLSMVDALPFQALAFKYQLGVTFLIYPSATHTRKQHCFGAFQRTKLLTSDWIQKGFINKDQGRTLTAYALYHDIGHGPFSHVIEPVCSIDHDTHGMHLVEGLKKEIEASDVDYRALHKMFEHADPLYLAVFDKNLGMEKFDYLERDAYHTVREAPGVDYLMKYIYYINDKVVLDEHAIDEAKAIQEFYVRMSKNVYLRKKSSIMQRFIQTMIYELMQEGLTEKELWNLTDFGLLGRFEVSENPFVKFYYSRLMSGRTPKAAVEFRYEEFVGSVARGNKPLEIFGITRESMEKLLKMKLGHNLRKLREMESHIAHLAGIAPRDILVVPPFSSERFKTQDVNIYRADGSIDQMSKVYPHHFKALEEHGRSHHSLRVCTFAEHRDKVFKVSSKIKKYIVDLLV